MAVLEKPRGANATLSRRGLLALAGAAFASACRSPPLTVSKTPRLEMDRLNDEVGEIAERARPGLLGVGLMNLESGEAFLFDGDRAFPMQDVFKLPLAAAALADVDAGRVLLDERFFLIDEQLSAPPSLIGEAWPARREYTARDLIVASVALSDNTAADVLMKRIGGPGAVTAWLDAKRVDDVRVDRYERQIQTEVHGMASFRPAWRTEAAFAAALASVPPQRRLAAMRGHLADPRDTATPRGMLEFLSLLNGGELLSPASTRLLLEVMIRTPMGPRRLRAGLPEGTVLAHKTGTGRADLGLCPAVNDVGIFTLPDKRSYAVAAFLAGSTLAEPERDAVLANLARAAVRGVG